MKWYKSKCVKTQAESSRRKSKDIHYSTGKRREGHCRPSDFLASICSFHKRHLGATKSSERSNKKLFPNPSTLDAGTESQPEYVSLCSMWVVENRNIPARILEVFLEWSLEAGKEQMDSCMQGLDFLKAYPYCLRQKTNFKATLNCLMVYFLYLLAYFTDNWNFDNTTSSLEAPPSLKHTYILQDLDFSLLSAVSWWPETGSPCISGALCLPLIGRVKSRRLSF